MNLVEEGLPNINLINLSWMYIWPNVEHKGTVLLMLSENACNIYMIKQNFLPAKHAFTSSTSPLKPVFKEHSRPKLEIKYMYFLRCVIFFRK